jgi:hypothetical protein
MDGNGFTTATASASIHRSMRQNKNGYAHFLSYQPPRLPVRNTETTTVHERARAEPSSKANPREKPMQNHHGNLQFAEEAGLSYIHMYHALMPACLPAWRSQHRTARAPSPREAPHMGQKHFLRKTTRCGVVALELPPYELQRDAGEIRGSGLSPCHRIPSYLGIEVLGSSGSNSERLVENVGHVKAGNLAVEHRHRKKALSTHAV